ncbi:galanin receptor type 1-like [Lineus longissimus]|uniref:galanin receptor type 1-like n=1 Tax=Lineus longissimus TaxID=88925 RepID=UPI00315DBBDA
MTTYKDQYDLHLLRPTCNESQADDANCSADDSYGYDYYYDYYTYASDLVLPEAYAIPSIFGFIFVVGLVGNSFVVYVVLRNGAMKTVTNLYLVNLAVADLLFLVFCVPFTAWLYVLPNWIFGEPMCKLTSYLMVVTMAVSILTLTAMGLERYYAIVHPVRSRVYRTIETTLWVLGSIWVASFLVLLPILFVTQVRQHFDYGGWQNYCMEHWSVPFHRQIYTVLVFTLLYMLPLMVIAGCYLLMARNLWSSVSPEVLENESWARRIKSRRKITKMVLMVVVVFCICWLPIHTINLWNDFGITSENVLMFKYVLKILAHCLSYANSAVNPIIYSFLSENFRKCFKLSFLACARKVTPKVFTVGAPGTAVVEAPRRQYQNQPASSSTEEDHVRSEVWGTCTSHGKKVYKLKARGPIMEAVDVLPLRRKTSIV